MPTQVFWIKKNAIRYGLPDSRFLQSLVDRAMQDPIFVQAGVLGYCIEEYVGLTPPKPIANELVACIQDLLTTGAFDDDFLESKTRAETLLAKLK